MTTTTKTTKTLHAEAMDKVRTFEDGTYNMNTLEACSFDNGYQVTFCQIGDNYSDSRYDYLVSLFCELSSDGVVYIGKFDGEPEISFHFESKKLAKQYAKMFNQISIWNWAKSKEIKTGGTGRR